MKTETPILTVIAIFYNGQREAARTLYTLSTAYQKRVSASQYKVIAIDNGSDVPLDEKMVRGMGENFSYQYQKTDAVSPCATLNAAIKEADTPYVMCIIDGAHMLSPGLLFYTLAALRNFEQPFVYTLALQLGEYQQNYLVDMGYNQEEEDKMLETVDWKDNGYQLFTVSNFKTYRDGFFSKLNESNCFAIRRDTLIELGGFDERFVSPGGGYVNLDVFKKIVEREDIDKVMLIGEASFHQFHGGVTTNKSLKDSKILQYREEYRNIRGEEFRMSIFLPHYSGHFPAECADFFPESLLKSYKVIARKLVSNREYDAALLIYREIEKLNKYMPMLYGSMGNIYLKKGDTEKAAEYLERSIKFNPGYSVKPYVNLGRIYAEKKYFERAHKVYKDGLEVDRESAELYFAMAKLAGLEGKTKKAVQIGRQMLPLHKKNPVGSAVAIEISEWFRNKKMYKAAVEVLIGSLLKSKQPRTYVKLGELYECMKKPVKAKEAYRNALKLGFKKPALLKNKLSKL